MEEELGKIRTLLLLWHRSTGRMADCSDDFARIFVKRSCLGQRLDRFLKLRVVFQVDFVPLVHPEDGSECFFPDFMLNPWKVLCDIGVSVLDLVFVEIFTEKLS